MSDESVQKVLRYYKRLESKWGYQFITWKTKHFGYYPDGKPNISEKEAQRNIEDLGFKVMMFPTGTPPRLDGKTIDFSKLEPQYSDNPPVPFSFRTPFIPKDQKLLPCHIP